MTPGACQCVPEWKGDRHQWSCLKAGQKRVPDCVCGHARGMHGPSAALGNDVEALVAHAPPQTRCTVERCPCTHYQVWGQR